MNTRSVGVWLSCSFLVLACESVRTAEEPAAKPLEVPVARPIVREVTDYEDFTGRTEAVNRVDLRARVTGYLVKSFFKEGSEVKQGDLLFEIDPRPYQAQMDRAEAAVHLAEAQLKLAEADLQRAKALLAQKVVAPGEIDKPVAERAEAEARVRAAKAGLEVARLNLDFTRVRAPIAGRIGRQLLTPGNLVSADETILATVVSRDPMYVYFDVDERTLLRLRRSMREGKEKPEMMPVFIGLAGDEGHPQRGVVDFTDNQVNAETGTIRMRAVLPNKDDLLVPGLFVRVRLALGAPYKALLVPAEAVLADNGVQIVYVVNDKGAIESRTVETGRGHDGLRIVNRGLKPEDRVVVGRQQRLRPGMTVRPVEGKTPSAPPAPAKRGVDARPVRGEPGPVILVEAEYPGASAAVVADVAVHSLMTKKFMETGAAASGRHG